MAKSKKNTAVSSKGSSKTLWVAIIALIIGLVVGYMVAKVKYSAKITVLSIMYNQKDSQLNELRAQFNRMVMVNGQMVMLKDGEVSEMTQAVTLPNGTKVTESGEVTMPSGKSTMMQNGDSVGMDGMVVGPKMNNISF